MQGPLWLLDNEAVDKLTSAIPALCSKVCAEVTEPVTVIAPVIDVAKYSSYRKVLRIAAYVRKFITLKTNYVNKNFACRCTGRCASCMIKAESCLVKLHQKISFPDVFAHFKGNSCKPAIVHQLKLVNDNGLIRSVGRLKYSSMTDSCKYPILLPSNSPLTRLIIADAHVLTLHSGVNGVLNFLRERWWVPRGRQAVKKVISGCVSCLKVQGKPYTYPADPPLPAGRVAKAKPFQVCGVDYSGALSVKSNDGLIKAYIVLFTCAITRAIHLEVVYSLSEEDFLRAFIKFSSRRSFPQILYSDNASNFVATSNTLEQVANSRSVSEYFADNRLQWRFITPRAAWHGGIWERMIGLVKSTLKRS